VLRASVNRYCQLTSFCCIGNKPCVDNYRYMAYMLWINNNKQTYTR